MNPQDLLAQLNQAQNSLKGISTGLNNTAPNTMFNVGNTLNKATNQLGQIQSGVNQLPQTNQSPVTQNFGTPQPQSSTYQAPQGSYQAPQGAYQPPAPVNFGQAIPSLGATGINFSDPNTAALFGLSPTRPEQQFMGQGSDILSRLSNLQNQLSAANVPPAQLTQVNDLINQTSLDLANTNPIQYYQNNPGLKDTGITQGQLEQQVAQSREPITQSLSQLLVSKSVLGEQQQRAQQMAQSQINALTSQYQIGQSMSQLQNIGQKLPENVSQGILQYLLTPKIQPNFETILGPDGTPQRVNIPTNQFGQAMQSMEQNLGKTYVAPNIFNYAQSGAAQPLINALGGGQIAPEQVNSRNAPILSQLFSQNQNFNAIQANAAANFWQSTNTQDKLAWANTTEKDFTTLKSLSDSVPRTAYPLINQALLKGQTVIAGNPQATAFLQASNRVAASLSNVLGDSGGSDFRTKLANSVLDPSFSKETFDKVLATESSLINNLTSSFKQQGGQATIDKNANIDLSKLNFKF